MQIRILIFLDYALPIAAPILLAWDWWRSMLRRRWSASLLVVTVSCLWLLLALAWRGAMGPDYTNTHAYILSGNLLARVVVAAISIFVRSQRSIRVIISALGLAWVWFVTLSLMYAV
ncbi:MAG: hypothetical protein WA294_05110 [Acidobacteriaceae bacterium]